MKRTNLNWMCSGKNATRVFRNLTYLTDHSSPLKGTVLEANVKKGDNYLR